ncbi:MAG TPA: lipoate--protein ligase family protein [Verrucomicrobiae bacterium]|jgi:lipoate-protein ligase A
MHYLDLTLPNPAANLACDEALLDACEEDSGPEVLRFWEPRDCFVVAGFSNSVAREVNLEACRGAGVGVFRRCSGGGTVLQGPGCLNYTLVLKLDGCAELETIPRANRHIMARQCEVLSALLGRPAEVRGCTDLAIDGLKFSGNAQRRKRHALIFHGTFLLAFDLNLMDVFLAMPSREPEYRQGRPHTRFLTNLNVPAGTIKNALREAWSATEELGKVPDCQRLVAEKYSRDDWNLKF